MAHGGKIKVGLEWEGQGHARVEVGSGRSIDIELPLGEAWSQHEMLLGALQAVVLARFLERFPQPSERMVSYFSDAEMSPGAGEGRIELRGVAIHPHVEVSRESDVSHAKSLLEQIGRELGDAVKVQPTVAIDTVTDVE